MAGAETGIAWNIKAATVVIIYTLNSFSPSKIISHTLSLGLK
jgi:hypothetical protein